jgi:hypothetical protein
LIRKISTILCLLQIISFSLYSEQAGDETLSRILDEAVTIFVHSKIVFNEQEEDWETDITKVTIPGRTVTLLFKTEKEKLSIELTPFKVEDGSYMLAAVSNFWHEDEKGAQFRSSFKSIKMENNELILFYPLGLKTQEAISGGSIHMELAIKILPYKRETKEQTE